MSRSHYEPDDVGGGIWKDNETDVRSGPPSNTIVVLSEDGGGGHPDDPNSNEDWQDCLVYFTWQDRAQLRKLSLTLGKAAGKPSLRQSVQ
jgi:hypothetical protein